MKHRGTRTSMVLLTRGTVLLLGLLPRVAEAQALWSPTDGRAKPVALLGADLSMTSHFDIREEVKDRSDAKVESRGGGGCHSRCHEHLNKGNHPRYRTALFESLARLKSLTEEFEEQFVWGGFTYAGAHYAQIVGRALPDPGAMQGSFQAVFGADSNALLSAGKINTFLNEVTTNTNKKWKRCGVQNPAKQGTEFCEDGRRFTRNFETAEKILPPEIPASLRTFEPNPCLVPDASGQCQHDDEALLELTKVGLPGLSLPRLPASSLGFLSVPTSASCDLPNAPEDEVFPASHLAAQLAGTGWPHWESLASGGIPSEQQVNEGICEPLLAAVKSLRESLALCLASPTAYLDLAFVEQPLSSWCDASAIRQSICSSGPLEDSCLCRPTADRAGCFYAAGETPCGTKMSVRLGRPGRHHWAMCEISAENTSPDSIGYEMSRDTRQFDNVMQEPDGRENITVLYTDGYLGGVKSGYGGTHAGINGGDMTNSNMPIVVGSFMRPQAQQTLDSGFWANQTQSPTSNLFVFNHMRDRDVSRARDLSYTPGSHRLQEVLRDPTIDRGMPLAPGMTVANSWGIPEENESSPATDVDRLREAFRRSLNRAMAGSYRGAQPALDRKAELLVTHDFTVFGPKKLGMAADHPGEDFVPQPSRLSFYRLGEDRDRPELLCETDWQDRASRQIADGSTAWASDPLSRYSAPLYSNPSSGMVRDLGGSILDRDGDGRSDAHPALTLGKMAGGKSTTPVVVGAPVEIPLGADARSFAEFMLAARTRPQVAYVMSNGFIHGFHAGSYQAVGGGFLGGPKSFSYDLGSADLCKELWRHRPEWVSEKEVILANTTQARQLMDGPMAAHEVRVGYAGRASDYKTLLVAAQGKMGRGMIALDVTNPLAPSVFRSWSLPPGARATSLPVVAEAVSGVDGQLRPMVFMSGGYRGVAALHMFDLASGEQASISLPAEAGEDYPSSPVCFDRDGRGGVTHCYLVSRFGQVVRVAIDPSGGASPSAPDPRLTERLRLRTDSGGCFQAVEPGTTYEEARLALAEGDCQGGDDEPVLEPTPALGTAHVVFGDVRPTKLAGLYDSAPSGRRFYVTPAVYFDDQNRVNLVFGSGDIKEMQRPAAVQNFVYKLVEPGRASWGMTLAKACAPSPAGAAEGAIPLPEGYMMVSPASVASGVVSFTAYRPMESAMKRGTSVLYSMSYSSCADAYTRADRPEPRPIGEGLPGTPILLPERKVVLAATTLRSGAELHVERGARPVADGRVRVRRLYWRPLTSDRAIAPQSVTPRRRLPGPVEEPVIEDPSPVGPGPELEHIR